MIGACEYIEHVSNLNYILPELTTRANASTPVRPSCVGGRGNPSLFGHVAVTVNCQQSGGHYTFCLRALRSAAVHSATYKSRMECHVNPCFPVEIR